MHTETRQISNLRSQDISKEIIIDLVRKDNAQVNDKFYNFQHATLEIIKGVFNDCSVLKLRLFSVKTPTLLQRIVKRSPISIMQLIKTPKHIFYGRVAQNKVRLMSIFFICHSLFCYAAFFHLKGKLKDSTHYPYDISNNMIQCYQFSSQIYRSNCA